MDYTVHGILQARTLECIAFPLSRDLPNPGIKPRSPALWTDSLPAEPPGKPKNQGACGNLSLLQQLYPTQRSNPGLLHYRRILYHLSHQGLSFLFFSSVPLPKGLFYYLSLQKANSCFCWYPPFLYFLFSWFFLYHYYFLNFIWIYSVFILTYKIKVLVHYLKLFS